MNFQSFAEQHSLIINHLVMNRWVRCPKVCEDDMGWLDNGGGELCAAAIRARNENASS